MRYFGQKADCSLALVLVNWATGGRLFGELDGRPVEASSKLAGGPVGGGSGGADGRNGGDTGGPDGEIWVGGVVGGAFPTHPVSQPAIQPRNPS